MYSETRTTDFHTLKKCRIQLKWYTLYRSIELWLEHKSHWTGMAVPGKSYKWWKNNLLAHLYGDNRDNRDGTGSPAYVCIKTGGLIWPSQ